MVSLYPHQIEGLKAVEGLQNCALYWDMGLGKTFGGSEQIMQYGNYVNLVICQKSKIDDWAEHFEKHYPKYEVYDLTQKRDFEIFTSVNSDRMIGIINYELAFRRPALKKLHDFTLLLDESSMIQNENAKRSKFILNLNPRNVILLSGTPTAGKYENLWSQLHLLGWNITKKRYMEHYVDTEWIEDTESGFKIPHVIGYKNVDRLKEKLAEYGANFMKSDEAFKLPEQIEIPVMVSTSKEYRTFMKKNLVAAKKLDANISGLETGVESELIGDTTLTKRLYARQLCGQYSKEKLQAFEDLVFSTNERLIVFYNFNEELSLLQQVALKKTPNISYVNGNRKDLQAYFLYDDSITFVQYQAGAMGLNLQKANRIVYYTLTDKSELFEQSKKRIHRIGQEKTCFYHYLLCKNSVEMDVLATLKLRKDYTDELFNDYSKRNGS